MTVFYTRGEQRLHDSFSTDIEFVPTLEALDEYAHHYKQALAPGTIKQVELAQRQFNRWCECNYLSSTLPISPFVIAKYVEFLGGKLATQTIKNRVWALGEIHRSAFLPSPCKSRVVTLAIRAVQRKHGCRVSQAVPLCKPEVAMIANGMGSDPIDLRDIALLIMASDSWCRASELVRLKVKDIQPNPDGSSAIHIPYSKLDPYGRGEFAFLSRKGSAAFAEWTYAVGLKPDDPAFISFQRPMRKLPIVPTTVSRVFKKVTGRPEITSHSTRVGGVHDALRLGCDVLDIMLAGRWKSPEMPAVYGRKILAAKSAAAQVCKAYEGMYK